MSLHPLQVLARGVNEFGTALRLNFSFDQHDDSFISRTYVQRSCISSPKGATLRIPRFVQKVEKEHLLPCENAFQGWSAVESARTPAPGGWPLGFYEASSGGGRYLGTLRKFLDQGMPDAARLLGRLEKQCLQTKHEGLGDVVALLPYLL